MDSQGSLIDEEKPVETVFTVEVDESSEEPPMDEWSSLEILVEEANPKKILYEAGRYDPGTGEICAEYIAMSASSVFRHPYYSYPAIKDPGIKNALLNPEEKITYPDDGQELYLAVCSEMNLCPISIFYKGLLEKKIDLKYYGVNPRGVRAMAMSLKYNTFVTLINLTDNFLTIDACYHLGEMIGTNGTLVELNLSGCRIGPDGAKMLLANMPSNRSLRALNLSKNELGDAGMEHLANTVFQGLDIKMINLSNNNISGKGLGSITEAFETHNNFTHWNLSWNNLFSAGTYNFLSAIPETSKFVKKMDLSWNALAGARVAQGIRNFLTVNGVKHLNLSNNKLEGEAIKFIMLGAAKALKLKSLNLSSNPLTPKDTLLVLQKLKPRTVKVERVLMDNVLVNREFLALLKDLKHAKPRLVVTYGGVLGDYDIIGPDPREVVLNRMDYLGKKQKKAVFDIAIFAMRLEKEQFKLMLMKDFFYALRIRGGPVDEGLVDEMVFAFRGPGTGQARTINIPLLVDYIKRKYPDRHLPPTPPPELMPAPAPAKDKGKKGK